MKRVPLTKQARRYRRRRRLSVFLLCLGGLGVLLHLTVRDRAGHALGMVFYALAPLTVVLLFVWAGVLALRIRHVKLGLASCLATALGIVFWIHTDYVFAQPADLNGHEIRVVLWNVARPSEEEAGFVSYVRQAEGDIVLLVESGENDPMRQQFWNIHFPEYTHSSPGRGITLLSRYPIVKADLHDFEEKADIAVYELRLPSQTVTVTGVDIESDFTSSREPSIDHICETETTRSGPVIVLGDFNTPHTSALFDGLRTSFQHAFEQSGRGFVTTWPAFFPALALDHIWLSRHFEPIHAELRRTFRSDHAMVIADVRLTTTESAD